MKNLDIATILLNLMLITYFIYFNVIYVLPKFQKKTENFEDEDTFKQERELDILEISVSISPIP